MLIKNKNWKKNLLLIGLLLIGIFSVNSIQIKNDTAIRDETGNFEDDYLFYGNELQFNGKADNLYFFGKKLAFNGEVFSGMTSVGEKIVLNGTIDNDLACAGRDIEINGKIDGTVFLAGKDVTIQKNAVINGTLFIAAQSINLMGVVNGDLYAGAGNFNLNSQVNGNVKMAVYKIQILENAIIKGNLNYKSDKELTEIEKGKVTGKIDYKPLDKFHHYNPEKTRKAFMVFAFIAKLIMMISFIIGVLLLLLLPITRKLEESRSGKGFWQYALWGLIPILIYPGMIFIGFIIMPIAVVLILALVPIIFLTTAIGITMFGQYLFSLLKWNKTSRYLYFLFGALVYIICQFIPVLNVISMIFFSSIGWGIVLEGLFNKKLA